MAATTDIVLEITFKVLESDPQTGRRYITAQTGGGQPMTIGYTAPVGDAVAVHGSAQGWPRIGLYADETRAVSKVIGAWGDQIACMGDDV